MRSQPFRSRFTATQSNKMTDSEIRAFLGERRTGCLGTVGASCNVHLTPVWFVFEAEVVYFMLGSGRLHLANLYASGKASLMVEEDLRLTRGWRAGARAVVIKGVARAVLDPSAVKDISGRIDSKYLGQESGNPEFVTADSAQSYVLWALAPDRTASWDLKR